MCKPRSLNNKMDEFRTTVRANNFDMCTLSETWFVPDRSPDYFDIDGHTLYSNPRPTRGDGVAMYVCENMHANQPQVIVPEDLEVIWLQTRPERLHRSVSVLIFAAVYFPDPKKEKRVTRTHSRHTRHSACQTSLPGNMYSRRYELPH